MASRAKFALAPQELGMVVLMAPLGVPHRRTHLHLKGRVSLRSGARVFKVNQTVFSEEPEIMSIESGRPFAPPDGAAAKKVPVPGQAHTDGLVVSLQDWLEDQTEKRVDEIEMLGEEEATGHAPAKGSAIGPGLRYLHVSRTIHQLVTDRNRAVGLYLAVASLLWTASSALLNARPNGQLLVPIEVIQRYCLPATFATLAALALFVGFMLVRTRIGLIYEVAKMNLLLGLPIGRVSRISPLSLFFLMHLLISVAGGCSAALFVAHVLYDPGTPSQLGSLLAAITTGVLVAVGLVAFYVATVLYTTNDSKLRKNTS
jgi:hypothetical protein